LLDRANRHAGRIGRAIERLAPKRAVRVYLARASRRSAQTVKWP
jgi:hypothetical protein